MALLHSDDFNRADNASAIGSPGTGGPYTVRVGTWGINSNRLYTSASTANAHVTFPAAVDVDLQMTLPVLGGGGSNGLIFRWVDASNYWIWHNTTTGSAYLLQRNVAGTFVTFASATPASVAGDILRVITKGTYIYAYVNGKMLTTGEDQFNSVATSTCGVRINSSTATRFDDLTASDAPTTIPGGADGATGEIDYDLFAAATDTPDCWVYKGRNTKTEDTGAMA